MALTQQRPIDLELYSQETDPTPIDQTVLILDHPSWTEPKKVIFPISSSSQDVLLGGNLITSSGWTSAGWTGNESIGWTHTIGNTSILSNVLAAIIDSNYQIQLTVTGRTAGSFTVSFGGDTSIALNSSAYYTILATTNGNLQITPTTDFDGTIIIAIKEVVWQITEAEILAILGITGTITTEEDVAANYVAKVSGKSLILDTEITRLSLIKKNVYEISFTATGSVATRIAAAIEGTDYPPGWVLAAGVSPVDLSITHSLNRRVANVSICAVTGTEEQALFNTAAFNGWKTPTINSLLIQSLATINKPIKVYITFV